MIYNIHYFFQHLLPLPFFIILASNIWEHFVYALASEPLEIWPINLSVPKLILYLIGNILTQYPFTNFQLFNSFVLKFFLFVCLCIYYNVINRDKSRESTQKHLSDLLRLSFYSLQLCFTKTF